MFQTLLMGSSWLLVVSTSRRTVRDYVAHICWCTVCDSYKHLMMHSSWQLWTYVHAPSNKHVSLYSLLNKTSVKLHLTCLILTVITSESSFDTIPNDSYPFLVTTYTACRNFLWCKFTQFIDARYFSICATDASKPPSPATRLLWNRTPPYISHCFKIGLDHRVLIWW